MAGLAVQTGAIQRRSSLTAEAAAWAPIASDIGTIGPAVAVPISRTTGVDGVFVVGRAADADDFGDTDMATIEQLASEATVVFDLTRARHDQAELEVVEDRERIARDLHDLVIQRLFACGMRLQAALSRPELLSDRSRETIDELDETIGAIRQSIFHDDINNN